jgi:hypothetical protein
MKIFNRRHNNGREDEQPTEVKSALDSDAVELLKNEPEEYFRRTRRGEWRQ